MKQKLYTQKHLSVSEEKTYQNDWKIYDHHSGWNSLLIEVKDQPATELKRAKRLLNSNTLGISKMCENAASCHDEGSSQVMAHQGIHLTLMYTKHNPDWIAVWLHTALSGNSFSMCYIIAQPSNQDF